ncbi:hypothetical protein OKA05_05815 [Luteolibacter arcticus]|uniref:Uncharacterized protein n=1 Tax=Luteolibacter arcticus TaxID=1581411 RepID=A0ABT3GEM4_9BACT|nr:hypothetical protein [Luteolibacter arcticus]MCW1922060.1 hypothetical protein [Luteolibacter arcticus]
MKSGIIDIFADAFGWVLGKAGLFVLAVVTGVLIGAAGLWAGTKTGDGAFGFREVASVPGFLMWVGAILPQGVLMFWAGMIFVRSESVEAKHWGQLAAIQAILLTLCCSKGLPEGLLSRVVAWSVVFAGVAAVTTGLRRLEGRRQRRGEEHLARLEEENALRREELKDKFGTESVGARELGIL